MRMIMLGLAMLLAGCATQPWTPEQAAVIGQGLQSAGEQISEGGRYRAAQPYFIPVQTQAMPAMQIPPPFVAAPLIPTP